MSALTSATLTPPWPVDVQEFAAQNHLGDSLETLLAAVSRLFPAALKMGLRLETDPEIRDDHHIVFDVTVSRAAVPHYPEAKRRWHDELFRLCPTAVCSFRLNLIRIPG